MVCEKAAMLVHHLVDVGQQIQTAVKLPVAQAILFWCYTRFVPQHLPKHETLCA